MPMEMPNHVTKNILVIAQPHNRVMQSARDIRMTLRDLQGYFDYTYSESDVTVICVHITISMLWGNTVYCVKLSGEGVSRYSNKIESVGLRKCSYYDYMTKKVMSQ